MEALRTLPRVRGRVGSLGAALKGDGLKTIGGLAMRRTEADATIRRMALAGHSDPEIAKHLGCDRQLVRRRRESMRLAPGFSPELKRALGRLSMRRICARMAA